MMKIKRNKKKTQKKQNGRHDSNNTHSLCARTYTTKKIKMDTSTRYRRELIFNAVHSKALTSAVKYSNIAAL